MSQGPWTVVFTVGGMIAAINSILAGIGIALVFRDAGLVIAIAASRGAITALVSTGFTCGGGSAATRPGLALPAGEHRPIARLPPL